MKGFLNFIAIIRAQLSKCRDIIVDSISHKYRCKLINRKNIYLYPQPFNVSFEK